MSYSHPLKWKADKLQREAQHAAEYGQEAEAIRLAAKAGQVIGTMENVADKHLEEHLEEIAADIEQGLSSFKSKGAPVAMKSDEKSGSFHKYSGLGRDSTGCRVKE